MNAPENQSGSRRPGRQSTPLIATEAWHRFVSAICLLACIGLIVMGIARLLDPTEGYRAAAKPMDYSAGICFILLGVNGARFLIRELRRNPAPPDARAGGSD